MPTEAAAAKEAKIFAAKVGNAYLKTYYDQKRNIEIITKDQFTQINKEVACKVEDEYRGEALDEAFKARVESMLEAKKNAVLGSGAYGNGAHAPPPPPPPPQQQHTSPAAAPSPSPPPDTGMEVDAEARKRAREPSDDADGERPATRPPPPEPSADPRLVQVKQEVAPLMPVQNLSPPQLQQLQPLERGSAEDVTNLVDLARLAEHQDAVVQSYAPPRPAGTWGLPLRVQTNACHIRAKDMGPNWGLIFRQYDVHFTWLESAAPESIPKAVTDRCTGPLHALFSNACTYDGKKILFSDRGLEELSQQAREAGWTIEADEAGRHAFKLRLDADPQMADALPPRTVVVKESTAEPLAMRKLCSATAREDLGPAYRKYFAVLDLALKPVRLYKPVKTAFYEENIENNRHNCLQLGRDPHQKLWLGYRQTIIDTVTGPMLMIDTAAAAMYAPCDLLDFLASKLQLRKEQLTLKHVKDAERQLTRLIGGRSPKVSSRHTKQTYKLAGIGDKPANEDFFEKDGRQVTVADHFAQVYNIRLKFPQLPCVLVGKKGKESGVRLPVELIRLVGGEPVQITPSIQAEMVKATSLEPSRRFAKINEVLQDKKCGGRAESACAAPDFEIWTEGRAEEVAARQLPSPRLQYRDHRTGGREVPIDVQTRDGSWKLVVNGRDVGFDVPGTKPRVWAVINFAGGQMKRHDVEPFMQMFLGVARDRGLDLGSQLPKMKEMSPPRDPRTAGHSLERELRALLGADYEQLDLVFCILPDPEVRNLYESLKRWSEATSGIALQCCRAGKIMGGARGKPLGQDKQYHAGIMLKLNLKLGGSNVSMAKEQPSGRGAGLGLMRAKPTMVCGVDVYHPPPGSSRPSWVALVYSLDEHCGKFETIPPDINKSRQEQIGSAPDGSFSLLVHMRTCLRKFVEHNKVPPERIIFYRDGVAHNQFDLVMAQEIAAIHTVLKEQGLAGKCELIFLVAQKRTNARFAAKLSAGGTLPSGAGGKGGGKGKGKGDFGKGGKGGGEDTLGNVPCGTVIDTDITDRHSFNFYLVSQHGLKGTARPTHYHVLDCPPTISADEMQQFTFDLCHVYARCTKIASRPAPLYYAHLAAAHAAWYEKDGYREVSDMFECTSVSSGGTCGSSKSKSDYEPLHPKQASRLYFC